MMGAGPRSWENRLLRDEVHYLQGIVARQWPQARVLILGDVILDKYTYGRVERISPEAPVPVVRAVRSSEQPGGAANVAMNVVAMGGKATLIGFTGQDADRDLLQRQLAEAGVEAALVAVEGTPTTAKLRVLAGQHQIVRLDHESTAERPAAAYEELLQRYEAALPSAQVVILSDYAKGVLTEAVCKRAIALARQAGVPVLVDPKSRDFSRYAGATTICPNRSELALATGVQGSPEQELQAGQHYVAELGLSYLTVTMSEKGIYLLWPERRHHAPAVARQVFDVSGAGDTVIASLALCAAAGVPPEQAAGLANLAAGIVVAKVGTVPASSGELLSELRALSADASDRKAMSLPELAEKTAAWRAAGQKVVFTNGCFDLVHVGHVTLLEQCREFGTRLVVGINSDASVSRLKGPTRPIIAEQQRARLLSALAVTDAVVIFDEPTPIEVIKAIRPDVLVKGGDYTEATVVGAPEVRSWGGRVELVPLVEGFSTSDIVRRITAQAKA